MALADGQLALDAVSAKPICGGTWACGQMIRGKQVEPGENRGPITMAPPLGVCLQANNVPAVFPLTGPTGIALIQAELCQKLNLRTADK